MISVFLSLLPVASSSVLVSSLDSLFLSLLISFSFVNELLLSLNSYIWIFCTKVQNSKTGWQSSYFELEVIWSIKIQALLGWYYWYCLGTKSPSFRSFVSARNVSIISVRTDSIKSNSVSTNFRFCPLIRERYCQE